MKNKIFLLFFLSNLNSNSQVVFEKYFGTPGNNNVGFYLQEVSDGYVLSGSSDNDGIIIKTDFNGNEVWQQNYSNGSVECLRSSDAGGYIIAGTDYNSPYTAVYRLTDNTGNILWDTVFTSAPFTMYGIAAMQMPDGDFALLENDTYPFLEFLRIRKISAVNQNTLWTKEISKVSNCSPSAFKLTIDSAIIVANGSFDLPYPKLVLSKTLQSGVSDWKKEYFFTGDTGIAGNSLALTNDSGYMVVGYKVFGNPQSDYLLFLMKTDMNGDSLWTREYNLNNSNAFPDIIQTSDGGFAVIGTIVYPPQSGNFDYRIIVMKTDSDGDSLWTREFTGYGLNEARKIIQTSDGGFAIIGTSTDQTVNQNYLYLIKTDSIGNILPVSLNSPETMQSISLYPNPVKSKIQIRINSSTETIKKTEIRNSLGQVCKSIKVNNFISSIQIDLNDLPEGIYLCIITTGSEERYISKFVKLNY